MRQIIEASEDILGGTAVFVGTRGPIKTFFDYLEGGEGVEEVFR
ncbi:MAG: DUF433 domain-containing protein [Deinococcales bacterium]